MHEIWSGLSRLLTAAAEGMRPYLNYVALAVSATLLAIFGGDINGWVKDMVKPYHLIVRLLVFVLLVAFGYGAVNLLLAHLLHLGLAQVGDLYLAPLVVGVFLLIGALAEHRKHI